MGGQSEGCHVVGQALEYDCSIAKAMILLDPVDGFDPYRFVKSQDLITPGKKLGFSTPTLLMDNSLDPKKANPLVPACAPFEVGSQRWYDALRGPVWNINATGFGHVDCLDDSWIRSGKLLCAEDGSSNKTAYRTMIAESVSNFAQ